MFFEKLDNFFKEASPDFQYATEIRNKDFLSKQYFQVLNNHSCTHCFNHWGYMPSLIDQMKAAANAGGLKAPFYVSRILTPLGLSYSQAVHRFQPYDQLKQTNPKMRVDVMRIARRAIEKKVKAYLIVNNRSEGHSPGTISEIGAELANEI